MYVVYSIKDQIHCTIMNYMYYLPHLFYSIFEVILFSLNTLLDKDILNMVQRSNTNRKKLCFPRKGKKEFCRSVEEKNLRPMLKMIKIEVKHK